MAAKNIEDLISLMESDRISKDELLSAIDGIEFTPNLNKECLNESSEDVNSIMGFCSVKHSKQGSIEKTKSSTEQKLNKEVYNSKGGRRCASRLLSNCSIPAKGTSPHSSKSQNNDFLQRMSNYQQWITSKRKSQEEIARELEVKDCVFKPVVNKEFNDSINLRDTNERLHNHKHKEEVMNKLRMEKHERESKLMENCTFHPSINKGGKSRYMENSKSNYSDNVKYTFKPTICEYNNITEQTQKYLSEDPYIRLAQQSNKAQDVLKKYEKEEIIELPNDAKERLENFYERQVKFELRKQENREKLLREAEIEARPQINKHSKEIVRGSFEGRNVMQRMPSNNYKIALEEAHRECTFKPKILETSKQLQARDVREMSYLPIIQRELKLKAMKENLINIEARECTFQPELKANRYSYLCSKLQLRDNIETYTERIELERQKLENVAKMEKKKREHKEIEECTYAPKINDFPLYILNKKNFESQRSLKNSSRRYSGSYSKRYQS